jgi:hypothetical protein
MNAYFLFFFFLLNNGHLNRCEVVSLSVLICVSQLVTFFSTPAPSLF